MWYVLQLMSLSFNSFLKMGIVVFILEHLKKLGCPIGPCSCRCNSVGVPREVHGIRRGVHSRAVYSSKMQFGAFTSWHKLVSDPFRWYWNGNPNQQIILKQEKPMNPRFFHIRVRWTGRDYKKFCSKLHWILLLVIKMIFSAILTTKIKTKNEVKICRFIN